MNIRTMDGWLTTGASDCKLPLNPTVNGPTPNLHFRIRLSWVKLEQTAVNIVSAYFICQETVSLPLIQLLPYLTLRIKHCIVEDTSVHCGMSNMVQDVPFPTVAMSMCVTIVLITQQLTILTTRPYFARLTVNTTAMTRTIAFIS